MKKMWWVALLCMMIDVFAATPQSMGAETRQVGLLVSSAHGTTRLRNKGTAATKTSIAYSFGPVTAPDGGATVIASAQIQGVYLGSGFSSGTNAATVTRLESYLNYLATSPYMTMLNLYGVDTGTAVPGKTLPVTLPHYKSNNRKFVTDSQIRGYLSTFITNGTLQPPSASTIYVVFTEPGVALQTSDGATSISDFLGYHDFGTYTNSKSQSVGYAYAVIPYPGSPNPTFSSQGYLSAFDQLTDVTSHEIAEATTDPNPNIGNGWTELVTETDTVRNRKGQILSQKKYQYYEEIADIPPMISSDYQVRLNGYLVQKVVAMDGQTLLSPDGSSEPAPSISSFIQVLLQYLIQLFQNYGITIPSLF